jgi:hypothetical protein
LFVGIPISIFNFVIRYFQSIINKKNIDKEWKIKVKHKG